MKTFKGKVAVITGAGSGMGRYLAVLLAQDGADVCVCDVNEETLNETVEMLRPYSVSVSSQVLDVADKAAVEALPGKVIEQHGKVDLVFNNAGVSTVSHFKDMDEDNWDWVMGINLDGVINSTRAFLPHMKDHPEAAIVNTSSIFGMVAVPGQTVYHTTKFAVRGFTESLALEMKETNPNLQIHCVHPGHIGTNIVASARMSDVDFDRAQGQTLHFSTQCTQVQARDGGHVQGGRHAPQQSRPDHSERREKQTEPHLRGP